jgi:MFS family permease
MKQSPQQQAVGAVALPAVIGCIGFLMAFDSTAIVMALPAMAISFGISEIATSGLVSAYLVAALVTLPLAGWLCERFGMRRVYLALIVLFALGSVLAAAADTIALAMAARILVGIVSGMMIPVGRLIMLKLLPRDAIMGALSVATIPLVIGPVLGPPIGGFIVDAASWRWLMLLNLPLALVAMVLALRVIPALPPQAGQSFDRIGALLVCAGLLALALALQTGIAAPPLPIAAGLAVAGLAAAWLYRRHMARREDVFIDLRLLRLPVFRNITIGTLIARQITYAGPFLISLHFQVGLGMSATLAGSLLLPNAVGSLISQLTLQRIIARLGIRPYLLFTSIVVPVLFSLTAAIGPKTPHFLIGLLMFAQGFLRSGQLVVASGASYAQIPQSKMTHANTILSVTQQLAGNLGIALAAIAMAGPSWLAVGEMATGARIELAIIVVAIMALAATAFFAKVPADVMAGQR